MEPPASPASHPVRILALALVLLAVCDAPSHAVRASGLFDDMAGAWLGSGRIDTVNGSEPIRCRAQYSVGGEGASVHQSLVCASASYRFNVESDLTEAAGRISGTWRETTRGLTGTISGAARGPRIEATITGPSFSASVTLVTRGNAQDVTITPAGSDVREVSVRMRKA